MMALNVIMMGPPGAGKGTQAERFARERHVPKISTGDILREAIKEQTPLGLKVKSAMDRGELVDDATIIEVARERLRKPDAQRGFVLDGFPRTVEQARALDELMKERGDGPLVVVDIVVPESELIRRLAGRRLCSKCGVGEQPGNDAGRRDVCERCGGPLVQRSDDTEEIVVERLKVYQRETKPIVEYYRPRPTFRVVNGAQPIDRVARELATVIDDAVASVTMAGTRAEP
jgi:adenylate kinase